MTDAIDKQERLYLLREGHFLGFGMGLLLSHWWWAALAWGVVLLALWGYSFRASDSASREATMPERGEGHACNFDRILFGGGMACTICDDVEPGDVEERAAEDDEDFVPQPGIPSIGPKEWTCEVTSSPRGFHVQPVRGMICTGNWALNPYHRRGFGNFCAQFWRMWSGAYIRREHPKSERMLRKAIAECEVWCEHERAAGERNWAVLQAVHPDSSVHREGAQP